MCICLISIAILYPLQQHALRDENSTKLGQLQQRTSQTIDTMKREAKEEREKIANRQMELETMIQVTLISHWALNLIPLN